MSKDEKIALNGEQEAALGVMMSAAKVLNNHCVGEKRFSTPPVCLCTTNREAKSINDGARMSVKGEARAFRAKVSGRFLEAEFPADGNLELVVGCSITYGG